MISQASVLARSRLAHRLVCMQMLLGNAHMLSPAYKQRCKREWGIEQSPFDVSFLAPCGYTRGGSNGPPVFCDRFADGCNRLASSRCSRCEVAAPCSCRSTVLGRLVAFGGNATQCRLSIPSILFMHCMHTLFKDLLLHWAPLCCFRAQTLQTKLSCMQTKLSCMQVARYCSKRCQVLHWRAGHRADCIGDEDLSLLT